MTETKAEDGTNLPSASHATSLDEKEPTATTGATVTEQVSSAAGPSKTQASDLLSKTFPAVASESAVSSTGKSEAAKKVATDATDEKSSVPTSQHDASAVPNETSRLSSVAIPNNWLCPPARPFDLIPLNADGETPEDVAFDSKEDENEKILTDLKKRYPATDAEEKICRMRRNTMMMNR
ncbi:hypothetical protein HK102_004176 [Quaeritorhiza haematococci]|nr:hypothetical protein HK102_004176 [Quaeritorhiza haematococci]